MRQTDDPTMPGLIPPHLARQLVLCCRASLLRAPASRAVHCGGPASIEIRESQSPETKQIRRESRYQRLEGITGLGRIYKSLKIIAKRRNGSRQVRSAICWFTPVSLHPADPLETLGP
jgi:hypothetical protein